jgi:elongator complex protein 2
MGITDRRLRIYTHTPSGFSHALSLEGHEDWVRCLAVTPCAAADGSGSQDILLASGSQDNYIRLWRIAAVADRADVASGGQSDNPLDMLDEFERKLAGEAGGSTQISTKAHVLAVEENGR